MAMTGHLFSSPWQSSLTLVLEGAAVRGVALVCIILTILLCWLRGGVSRAGFLRDPLRSRIVSVLFGLILVGTTALGLIGGMLNSLQLLQAADHRRHRRVRKAGLP